MSSRTDVIHDTTAAYVMSTVSKQPPSGWQANKSIIESNLYMLRNHINTDVCLEVGQPETKITLFFAHQYMLVSRSSVFEALLSNEKQQKVDGMPILKIPDTPPKAIDCILKYVYSGDVTMDQDIAFDVLRGAKMFNIPTLVKVCYDYLESHLSASKVCDYLEQASNAPGDQFTMQCMYYIWSNAEKVLESNGFTQLSEATLTAVISSNYIAVPEKLILTACLRWAEKRCTDVNIVPTPEMLRRCLGDIIYDIRFPLMEPTEFANLVGHSDLLTNDEKSDIYTHMLASNAPTAQKSQFISSPRTPKSVLSRFPVAMNRAPCERTEQGRESEQAIIFTVDHNILLCGIGVYGAISAGRMHVHMQLIANGIDPMSMASDLSVECDGQCDPYELSLPVPVYLSKQQPYTVVVDITGATTYSGCRGNGVVTTDGVTFTFSKSELSSNATGVESGQIPQLIFYKAPP